MTNLSDEEFDALLDAMPQGARNQVLSQMRSNEGEGVKLPEKHDLRKRKKEEDLGPVTESDLVELRERMVELGYKSFAPLGAATAPVDALPPDRERGYPEHDSAPQEQARGRTGYLLKTVLLVLALLGALVLLVVLVVLPPVVSVTLLLAAVFVKAGTVGITGGNERKPDQ